MFKKFLLFILIFGLAGIAAAVFLVQQPINLAPNKNSIIVEVKQGQTLSQLAHRWEKQGWLPDAKVLLVQARLLGHGKNLKPGEFEIPAQTSSFELLTLLTEVSSKRYRISLIEGTRLNDALIRLAQAPKLIQDVVPLNAITVQQLLALEHLAEGWLYPDTYVYQAGDSTSSILKQAHSRMQRVLAEEWQLYQSKVVAGKSEKLPYKSAYEALIMASIVEKETGQASERPEIAGVFIRRLNMNMRLATDPTVIYGLGEAFKGNLRKKHLRDRSNPYNTYRNKGLPPSPIALAGREAINAALNPDNGKSLYFVAKGDGSHYFSTSLKEHNRAVRKYQIFRRSKDYRSAPAAN